MEDKKITGTKSEETHTPAPGSEPVSEIRSDGSASAFNETERTNAESDRDISDMQLDELLADD